MKKILVSAESPTVQEVLRNLEIPFEFRLGMVSHNPPQELEKAEFAHKISSYLAEGAFPDENTVSLGVTTIVLVNDRKIRKPDKENELSELMAYLKNIPHTFITSFTVIDIEKNLRQSKFSELHIDNLTDITQPDNYPVYNSANKINTNDSFYKYSLIIDSIKETIEELGILVGQTHESTENSINSKISIPVIGFNDIIENNSTKDFRVDENISTGKTNIFTFDSYSNSDNNVSKNSKNIATDNEKDSEINVSESHNNSFDKESYPKEPYNSANELSEISDTNNLLNDGGFESRVNSDLTFKFDNVNNDESSQNEEATNIAGDKHDSFDESRVTKNMSNKDIGEISKNRIDKKNKVNQTSGSKNEKKSKHETKRDYEKREEILGKIGSIVELAQWFSAGDFVARFVLALIVGVVVILIMFGIAIF